MVLTLHMGELEDHRDVGSLLHSLFTLGLWQDLKVPLSASSLPSFLLAKMGQGPGSHSVSREEEIVMTEYQASEVSTALGEGPP